MANHYRAYYGRNDSGIYNLQWDIIRENSFVLVTASEGSPNGDTARPGRFVGAAQFRVSSIAPHPGGVTFFLEIGSERFSALSGIAYVGGDVGSVSGVDRSFVPWPSLLPVYVDITVF